MSRTDKNGLTMNGRLELVRRLLEYTRKEWADLLGCSVNLIANIEHGRQRPTSDLLEAISERFPYLIEYIITGQAENIFGEKEKAFLKELAGYEPEKVKEILNSKPRKRY
ncbi:MULTISPECIES: helix-turn-helix domain-containing protein [unclassified Endozoicomonas]|uniref:helix-turn-helix domain-containing protein n=1 Tax=unclassified Endozoicomonas TaxID=2644528 RepID=UPI003BB7BF7C